jgi:protein subunit release factor A
MLLRMYTRWAERHGHPVEVYDTSYAEEAGIKSATFVVKAPYAYGTLAGEHGTHRLVRISPFDNQSRRQTSFADVDVTPVVEQTDHIDIPDEEIRVDVYRSSGPGGQGVNTTDSAVRITHLPTGIVVSCQNERSQLQNKDRAMRMLKVKLAALAEEQAAAAAGDARRSQVRTVDRSERIRTYNYPQNRISDHRIGYTAYNLDLAMAGDLDSVLDALADADRKARLAGDDQLSRG